MRYWIGPWLIGISILHTAFAVILFGDVLGEIVKRGLLDSVGDDPTIGAVVWFTLFGALLCICGMIVWKLERATEGVLPKSLGWSLLALACLGVVLMPESGFWLAFPAAITVLIRGKG